MCERGAVTDACEKDDFACDVRERRLRTALLRKDSERTRYKHYRARCSAGNDENLNRKSTSGPRNRAWRIESDRFRFESGTEALSRRVERVAHASTMVTSTSTPGSMEMEVICLTTSAGECRSIRRLWMRSW